MVVQFNDILDVDKVYYLASPYSHPLEDLMNARYEAVNEAGASLCQRGFILIEPIAMCHTKSLKYNIPTGYEYWKTRDRKFISISGGIIVLMLPGWKESIGVSDEVAYAKELGLDIIYIPAPSILSDATITNILMLERQAVVGVK